MPQQRLLGKVGHQNYDYQMPETLVHFLLELQSINYYDGYCPDNLERDVDFYALGFKQNSK